MLNRLFAALVILAGLAAPAGAAALLPNGKQQFVDGNGAPLSGGRVYFYAPNTNTPKSTWQDAGQTTLNANPVILDSAGRATIYGSGIYRELVRDNLGNTIFDSLTSDGSASSGNWAGVSTGSANAQVLAATSFSSSDGQIITFRAGFTNTGALVINPNSSGNVSVLQDSINGPVGLVGGEVVAGNVYTLTYDATLGVFHLGSHPIAAPFVPVTATATTDLGSFGSPNLSISGTTQITSFGSSAQVAGPIYTLTFTTAVGINNSTALQTPSKTGVVMQPGEVARAYYQGNGNWILTTSAPTGTIMFTVQTVCPVGYIPADGTAATIDMRGNFPRGLDTSGLVDPSRTIGSLQLDAFQTHTHTYFGSNNSNVGTQGGGLLVNSGGATTATSAPSSPARTASETRPRNVALLACQKT